MSDNNRNLYYLHELSDYKVADHYSDVRGWEVEDIDSRTIGKVENLLVDKNDKRVVYLDVEVDGSVIEDGYKTYNVPANHGVHGFVNKDGDNHIIIPIEMATLDEENKRCEQTS
jgi:sporulation protein YlmC with PRC-barrel domain